MGRKHITISRQFGSGGHTIGVELSKRLNIPYYDQNLIEKVARDMGYEEEFVSNIEELESSSKYNFFYKLLVGRDEFGKSITDYIWETEQKVIRQLAEAGPCIFIGRCADYVLEGKEDFLSLYIYSNMEARKKRIVERFGEREDSPRKRLIDKDRKRGNHYHYCTGRDWGVPENYDLCINSGKLGIEESVEAIAHIWNR